VRPTIPSPHFESVYGRPRRFALAPGGKLVCPNGHYVPEDAIFTGHGAIRCSARIPDAHQVGKNVGECGVMLWVLPLWRSATSEASVALLAEVTNGEMRDGVRFRMDADAMLEFLGLTWPIRRLP